MDDIEDYKGTIEIVDKFSLNETMIDKSTIFNLPISIINVTEKSKHVDTYIPPFATGIIGIDNTSASLPQSDDIWTDLDAQEEYLKSKPTSYIIIGKPGVGAFSLGEELSRNLKCVHLCPYNIVKDEIAQASPTGNCIDFNLKHNQIICYDTMLELLKQKMRSTVIKHRGYVVSGFPLVTAKSGPSYFINSLKSEESVEISQGIFRELFVHVGEKKKGTKKKLSLTGQETEDEDLLEEEQDMHEDDTSAHDEGTEEPLIMPEFIMDPLKDIIIERKASIHSLKACLVDQLHEIFNLTIKPDIVIYLTCPDNDIITIKYQKFFDFMHDTPKCRSFFMNEILTTDWPLKYKNYIDNSAKDISYDVKYYFDLKYDCLQPFNFKIFSSKQLCNYNFLISLIENQIANVHPKYIIKLDGRFPVNHLMNQIEDRLHFIPVKPVIIPSPFYISDDAAIPENIEDFWKVMEGLDVIESDNLKINRYPSPWLNRCPVELRKRVNIQGKIKYAVEFLKHMYLLHSNDSLVKFCINPRPFLQLHYLEPICRVIVLGTELSGKSMVSECLAWLFDAQLIRYQDIMKKLSRTKLDTFSTNILPEITGPIEEARHNAFEGIESKRISFLNRWLDDMFIEFKDYVNMYKKFTNHSEELVDEEVSLEIEKLKDKLVLQMLNVEDILNDIEECKSIIEDKSNLLPYAPLDLTTPTPNPEKPQISDRDVTDAISTYIIANELQSQLELTPEEIFRELRSIIATIDAEAQQASNNEKLVGKWVIDGLVSTPELWSLLIESGIMPDYTISLLENNEITPEIIKKYRLRSNLSKQDCKPMYKSLNDPLVRIKMLSEIVTDEYENVIKHISIDIIERIIFVSITDETDNEITDEEIASFNEKIEKYRANLDDIRTKLVDSSSNHRFVIEIELEEKEEIEILEEVLLKVRKAYNLSCLINDSDEVNEDIENDDENRNYITDNDLRVFGETNKYCPIAFYKNNVLWEGKTGMSTTFNNKLVYCCNEESLLLYQKDPMKYQSHNFPFKNLPPLRICVIGCIGSGKTTLSRNLSSELGLLHLDFLNLINEMLMPKHFKKVSRDNADEEKEDNASVVQIEEDMELNDLNFFLKEKELRAAVFNYIERGEPLPQILLQNLLTNIWFNEPYCKLGFVLDGFPKSNADVEIMIANFCIPDVVIEIESDSERSVNRIAKIMFNKWKISQANAKRQFEMKRKQWLKDISKKIIVEIIIDDLLDNLFPTEDKEPSNASETFESQLSESKIHINSKLMKKYDEYIELYPEPINENAWEDPDEVLEKIEVRLQEIFELEYGNIESLKDMLSEQKINVCSLDGSRSKKKLFVDCLLEVSHLRNRNESFFEQTFFVDDVNAELLLNEGLVMISKFNRMCPVYIYEHPSSIHNPYKLETVEIYHVIHRCFLYFVFGKDNLIKFRSNPLKYVSNKSINSYMEYSLKVGVIGPPKSGKSSLVTKLANTFGLQPISKGLAIRYVLKNLYWTDLGKDIIKTLSEGSVLKVIQIIRAVQTVAMVPRVFSYGFVLDGFPQSSADYKELCNIDLNPIIVFHISCDVSKTINNAENEIYYNILCHSPPYSKDFLKIRLPNWHVEDVNKYINNSAQNVYYINGEETQWECWKSSQEVVDKFVANMHQYLGNMKTPDIVTPSNIVCISKDRFQHSMSDFKNLCPICIRKCILKHSDWPDDREGIIQYKHVFYWVCNEHFNYVLKHPCCFLVPTAINIPEIPAVISHINKNIIHENGICVVTYAENLPSQKIVAGLDRYAAAYKGKHYLFCNLECLTKFMEKPHLYNNIRVYSEVNKLPKIPLNCLPNLGYLEQSLANILTEACTYTNKVRPKYPGLNIKLSGLILLGLYFKIHNPLLDSKIINVYSKVLKVYEARCKLLNDLSLKLRAVENPFAKYPDCCPCDKNSDSDTVIKPPSIESQSYVVSTPRTSIMSAKHVK